MFFIVIEPSYLLVIQKKQAIPKGAIYFDENDFLMKWSSNLHFFTIFGFYLLLGSIFDIGKRYTCNHGSQYWVLLQSETSLAPGKISLYITLSFSLLCENLFTRFLAFVLHSSLSSRLCHSNFPLCLRLNLIISFIAEDRELNWILNIRKSENWIES